MEAISPPSRDAAAVAVAGADARASAGGIDMALVRELYGPRKPLLAANLGGAALLAAVLWDSTVRTNVALWAGLVAGVTLLRHALVMRFNARDGRGASAAFWIWAYAAGALAGGVLWGTSVELFRPASPEANVQIYVLIVAGLSAAAMSGYAICPVVFIAFLVPAALPFGWHLFHSGGQFRPAVAALFFLWLTLMIVVVNWRASRIAETIGAASAEAERAARAEVERKNAEKAGETRARVVAQLSHELRTPLNAIVGFSEAIKHGVFGPVGNPRYSAYADNIHDSGRHLLAVIERALADGALGSDMPPMQEGDVDLREIAAEAVATFETRARQCAVALVLAVEEPAPAIRGNALKLKQVLINLLSNAVKFTPPGGRVVLEISTLPDGGVVLRVADTGVGMDAEEIRRALDPTAAKRESLAEGAGYSHGDRASGGRETGRGVGLLIAKWLTELHDGKLLLESAKDVGTTATVQLPASRRLPRLLDAAPARRVK